MRIPLRGLPAPSWAFWGASGDRWWVFWRPVAKLNHWSLGSLGLMMTASVVCLTLGVLALLKHQPYGVWYGLMLPGFIGLVVLGSLAPVALMRYREAENRKMQARDL